jgi:hypothetical protein
MVECQLPKLKVASSSLVTRSTFSPSRAGDPAYPDRPEHDEGSRDRVALERGS